MTLNSRQKIFSDIYAKVIRTLSGKESVPPQNLAELMSLIGFASKKEYARICLKEMGLSETDNISLQDFSLWGHYSYNRLYLCSTLYKNAPVIPLDITANNEDIKILQEASKKYAQGLNDIFR